MKDTCTNITICAMNELDLEDVLAIEAYSYPLPWTKAHFLQELNSPNSFPLVAMDFEGRVEGYICPMTVTDEGHILNVAVRKECRGRKIAKLLVERVLAECRIRGASFVALEVRPSNSRAIALYNGLGFTTTGRRKHYYENGEDAILMEYSYTNEEEGGNAV